MDFEFSEEQETIRKVARRMFETRATKDHLAELEAQPQRYDNDLWDELAGADLLGIALPESVGGSGHGFVEVCVLLSEVGWSVAPVPVYATLVLGADPIARAGSESQCRRYLPGVVAGESKLTAALTEPGRSDPTRPATRATRDGDSWRLDGVKDLVPSAQLSDHVLVPATTGPDAVGLFIVDSTANGIEFTPASTTNSEPYADVTLDGCRVTADDTLGDPEAGDDVVRALHDRALVGTCAMQLGVSERALRIAADYTSEREQFGRPIGSFQAVQQRMADAFIDVEAMRWTMWQAAWLISEGMPATRETAIAKFWACEAGARVAATAQQVHGGIGIDISYPLFRYFLWAKQLELALGSAPHHLARIGATYSEETT
jgi:alkylation response protein AidB-like acyl-CoA dehydrogenase